MTKKYIIIAFLFIAFTATVSFLYLNNDQITFETSDEICDLRKSSCKIKVDSDHIITFDIAPRGIFLSDDLNFTLVAPNIKANTISLKIYGVNMNMGTHNIVLKRVENDTFKATSRLPKCQAGGMIWNADISSSSFAKNKVARFTFKSGN